MSIELHPSTENEIERPGKAASPCAMVIFGGTGDLASRKLVPALYNLVKLRLLPRNFAVIGVAHDELSPEQFRAQVTQFLDAEDQETEACKEFTRRLHYQRGDFADPATYSVLADRLSGLDQGIQD